MRVKFSDNTTDDFKRHKDYLRRKGKSDGHGFQEYELNGISKALKKNISKGLEDKKEHKDSIFPKEKGFEYNVEDYKMYVDKRSHHVVFYNIIKPKKGASYISIDKCIHSTELKRELERKGIEPLKDADTSLLDDLNEIYKEDEINLKDDSDDDRGKEEEVYDEETGKKVKRIVYTGPQGGRYYKGNKGEKIYIKENMVKKMKPHMGKKITSLYEYIKREMS